MKRLLTTAVAVLLSQLAATHIFAMGNKPPIRFQTNAYEMQGRTSCTARDGSTTTTVIRVVDLGSFTFVDPVLSNGKGTLLDIQPDKKLLSFSSTLVAKNQPDGSSVINQTAMSGMLRKTGKGAEGPVRITGQSMGIDPYGERINVNIQTMGSMMLDFDRKEGVLSYDYDTSDADYSCSNHIDSKLKLTTN
jgi:hypothetical protein